MITLYRKLRRWWRGAPHFETIVSALQIGQFFLVVEQKHGDGAKWALSTRRYLEDGFTLLKGGEYFPDRDSCLVDAITKVRVWLRGQALWGLQGEHRWEVGEDVSKVLLLTFPGVPCEVLWVSWHPEADRPYLHGVLEEPVWGRCRSERPQGMSKPSLEEYQALYQRAIQNIVREGLFNFMMVALDDLERWEGDWMEEKR